MRQAPPSSDGPATRWHPATKLLLAGALLAVPYLLWTRPDSATGGVAAPPPPRAADGAAAPASPPALAPSAALEPYALPPLERFAAVVERPLFSPTRRMPPIPEPAAEAPPSAPETGPAPDPGPSGPAEPDLRFFGTYRQGGTSAALVTFPATNAVARLVPGDKVGEWSVLEVGRDRLVLGAGEERRSFEMFAPGGDAAPAAAPAAALGPSGGKRAGARRARAVGGGAPADAALPADEGPPADEPPPDELPPPDGEPLGDGPTGEEPPPE